MFIFIYKFYFSRYIRKNVWTASSPLWRHNILLWGKLRDPQYNNNRLWKHILWKDHIWKSSKASYLCALHFFWWNQVDNMSRCCEIFKIHYLRWLNDYIKFACYCNWLFSLLQQQTTSFGTTTTPFGGATSSGTSLFGTQQQPATGGLFGQQQTQQPSTGFSHPSSGFGSTSGGGLFGQTQQPTSTGITIL